MKPGVRISSGSLFDLNKRILHDPEEIERNEVGALMRQIRLKVLMILRFAITVRHSKTNRNLLKPYIGRSIITIR